MICTVTKGNSGLISMLPLRKITPEVQVRARQKFNQARKAGMIEGDYHDDCWLLKSELKKAAITFSYRGKELQAACEASGVSYRVLIDELKTFAMLLHGTCRLDMLKGAVVYIINELIASECGRALSDPSPKLNCSPLIKYIDFISVASIDAPEAYINFCREFLNTAREQQSDRSAPHPCRLSEFDSYFILDHCLQKFWETARPDERAYYYPLYLFWRTTTILPQRVTEFLVTPYDCIREKDGRYYLTIRRSRLKGMSGKIPKVHGYTIETDYVKDEYEITKELYGWFKEYRAMVKDEPHPYGVLIPGCGDHLFDTDDLRDLMSDFYAGVILEKCRYRLMTEEDLLDRAADDGSFDLREGEVMMVQPKHTRHLAMINLIIRGCNPSLIRHFAGHTSSTMSANYYGNTVNLVRCAVKRFYEHTRTDRQQEIVMPDETRNALQLFIDRTADSVPVDGGRCYSERFLHQDISDCIACDGRCIACQYFDPDRRKERKHMYDCKLDAEFEYIQRMLKDENLENRIDEYNAKMSTFERHIRELAIDMLREQEKEEAVWDEDSYIQMNS